MNKDRVKIFKLLVLVVIILIMVFLTIELIPMFKSISTEEGRINFKNEIESLGGKGIFAIVGLMVAQIFIPILPRRAS